jgi:hypothetical protein
MQIQKNNFDMMSAAVSILYLLLLTFFLHEGYGVEEDSWGLVMSTFEMHQTHGYVASRLPGHPTHEYLLALLFPPSPFAYNFVSAIFGSLALYFSILFFKNIKTQFPILTGLTLAFTPVVFIAGTYTIDYSMSLLFIILSWYLLTSNFTLLAGVALALATGTRITNLYMIAPMFLYIYANKGKLKDYIWLSVSSSTLSILLFLPVIYTYGIHFFDYSDQFPYPNLPKLLYKSTFGVFGLIGLMAFLLLVFKFRKPALTNIHYALVAIALCIVAYLRLPQKSAYLIPMIPFILIIASNVLHFKWYKWFCGLMIFSGWTFGVALVDQTRGSISYTENNFKIKGQENEVPLEE